MTLHDSAAYQAVLARDARFDGRLFVGVTSTGIYCRPVCRVRTPLARNCRFFGNAASAELAGFRPCLRCRPELAPGLSLVDSPQVLAHHAARRIEQAARDGEDLYLPRVADELGVTDRHLRRIFGEVHGVSPMDFLTTQRLLLAKQLLTDTAMPVAQVALACGYASLRRFNDAFARRYRLSPTGLRREHGEPTRSADSSGPDAAALRLRLAYRPPYDIRALLRFVAARALPGIETVDVACLQWSRTVALRSAQGQSRAGWLAARFLPDRHEVELAVAPALLPMLGSLLQRVRQALDLDADPALIEPVLSALPGTPRPGLRVASGVDGFETAARVVLGQQVSVRAARTITQRLVQRFGEPLSTPFDDLAMLFPSAQAIAEADAEEIGRLGIVRQRVRALQSLAQAMHEGRIALHRGAPLAATLDALRALPGIGEWTVQLIAMRALAWPDAFAASDIGVLNALGTRDVREAESCSQAWRPWRAYALMQLWHSLENDDHVDD